MLVEIATSSEEVGVIATAVSLRGVVSEVTVVSVVLTDVGLGSSKVSMGEALSTELSLTSVAELAVDTGSEVALSSLVLVEEIMEGLVSAVTLGVGEIKLVAVTTSSEEITPVGMIEIADETDDKGELVTIMVIDAFVEGVLVGIISLSEGIGSVEVGDIVVLRRVTTVVMVTLIKGVRTKVSVCEAVACGL